MRRHYCTLFDRNYLFKGIALYRSLEEFGGDFILHILCMDDVTYALLDRMTLVRARLIRREDFEDPALIRVKPTRTVAEFCWTCTPSLPLYVLRTHPDVDLITYLDADLYLFSSPEPIFSEFGDQSILIVEHKFSPQFSEHAVNGKYNVEWLTFRRDELGMAALVWWRERCLEWCYYRLEDGKLGDQKYLDDWPERFRGVHVLNNVGGGVAPWNMSSYTITLQDAHVYVDGTPLIFFHFHKFRILTPTLFSEVPPMYAAADGLPRPVFDDYSRSLRIVIEDVRRIEPRFSDGIELVGVMGYGMGALRFVHHGYWNLWKPLRGIVRRVIPERLLTSIREFLRA